MLAISDTPIISIHDEKITQREAARLLGVSFPTCSRYMSVGRLGVRLPSAKVGGKRHTTRKAVAWWWEAVQIAEVTRVTPAANDDDPIGCESESELKAIAEREGL